MYHITGSVTSVENLAGEQVANSKGFATQSLLELAVQFPDDFILWCAEELRDTLNHKNLTELFHHRRLLLSYANTTQPYFGQSVGYIEDSPFIKVNPGVTYPTWQMHSCVGGIHAQVLLQIADQIDATTSFDFFLHTLSRKLQPQGLICQSEPRLLKDPAVASSPKASQKQLYAFVKQQFKTGWLFFLFFMQLRYEHKVALMPLLNALLFVKRKALSIDFENISFRSNRVIKSPFEVDVVIPTLGRPSYLYDVLSDLKNQDLLPRNVLIVEQVPDSSRTSQLDYLTQEEWTFSIDHTLIHTTGACNARNIALDKVTAPWVLLFDDDVRLEPQTLSKLQTIAEETASSAMTISCLQPEEQEKHITYVQWSTFGSGCSLVHKTVIDTLRFDMALEHGYGEDADFGMQIRNQGEDVLYVPQVKIIHLKAPTGGFRSTPVFPWKDDVVQPKPSPQIMYHRLKNTTKEQLKGYKWVLFFKYFRSQSIKNPFTYVNYFKKAWSRSTYWATILKN